MKSLAHICLNDILENETLLLEKKHAYASEPITELLYETFELKIEPLYEMDYITIKENEISYNIYLLSEDIEFENTLPENLTEKMKFSLGILWESAHITFNKHIQNIKSDILELFITKIFKEENFNEELIYCDLINFVLDFNTGGCYFDIKCVISDNRLIIKQNIEKANSELLEIENIYNNHITNFPDQYPEILDEIVKDMNNKKKYLFDLTKEFDDFTILYERYNKMFQTEIQQINSYLENTNRLFLIIEENTDNNDINLNFNKLINIKDIQPE